jgi:hypothetical protein
MGTGKSGTKTRSIPHHRFVVRSVTKRSGNLYSDSLVDVDSHRKCQ